MNGTAFKLIRKNRKEMFAAAKEWRDPYEGKKRGRERGKWRHHKQVERKNALDEAVRWKLILGGNACAAARMLCKDENVRGWALSR